MDSIEEQPPSSSAFITGDCQTKRLAGNRARNISLNPGDDRGVTNHKRLAESRPIAPTAPQGLSAFATSGFRQTMSIESSLSARVDMQDQEDSPGKQTNWTV
ncbi:MAG: hypothetical protein H0X34_19790 [Chthoniobacterales bacterium]|nr:hypothetical protein [Chthoniobacterales bacterium]